MKQPLNIGDPHPSRIGYYFLVSGPESKTGVANKWYGPSRERLFLSGSSLIILH